ncbi:uncharacterized protein CC84DRAFT_960161 [Paraphaeosphaeria sporulosa]|uniref:Uncharacterized protein n=1 Tax=Paraphaeosphaeria sporulosa TaxID=1460663 RepID=A0A177C8N5_9PLEO|nr:uncharacterized protein CC84DRAFT_960161 [Paraphaeosphaeria sporulosa]OAG03138.1 hypothetical protein CC84DRAFT_960161 [Paraphaeosphaeria sporulosa]
MDLPKLKGAVAFGISTKNDIFEKVHDEFIDSLPGKERAYFSKCSSPEELLETLRNFKILSTKRQKKTLNRCLDVVKRFNDKLRPYFDAINVIASANDTVAVAYGAIRLVLELASGFPAFFEKLIIVLEKLSDTFPQYSAIVELFEGTPPTRIRRHLESVYIDLFRFIQMATRIFTASSGKVKRPLTMITTVIWKPFDAQFSSLLESMEVHRNFIHAELDIHQAQQAKDSERAAAIERQRAEDERQRADADRKRADDLFKQTERMRKELDSERRESTVQRILNWLAPPQFAQVLENSLEQREEGTSEWIFESQVYKYWAKSKLDIQGDVKWRRMPPWVLWVHGNPGSGKTILAASVVEEVSESIVSELQNHQTCYFFFKHDDRNNSTLDAAYRSILAQILHRSRNADNILDIFVFARVSMSMLSGQQIATSKELYELIRLLASDIGNLTLVLDGIDEAVQPEMMCPHLKELVTASPIKLIMFSRPNINSLHKLVDQTNRIAVNREAMSPDIRMFLEHQLQDFVENEQLPDSANIEELAEALLHGADGMFLWAKLMINYLSSFTLSPQQRLATINSVHFPEGLNAMYDRILSLITTADTLHKDLARRILLWLNNVADDSLLTSKFLHDAISGDNDEEVPEDFASTVVSVCGGLVEYSPQTVFQLTHITVKEYLRALPQSNLKTDLIPNKPAAHAELTARCLQRVCAHAPTRPPTRDSGALSRLRLLEGTSFSAYAIKHWSLHLMHLSIGYIQQPDHESTFKMSDAICSFLSNPLARAAWIEGIYSQGANMKLCTSQLRDWICLPHSLRLQETANRLVEFSEDLDAIDGDWHWKLLQNPEMIWTDVLVFPTSRFAAELAKVLGAAQATTVKPLAPTHDNGEVIQCLSNISSLTSDGAMIATLNIYPSSSFERFWKQIDPSTAYEEAEQYCSDWRAVYEIWSTESKVRIASATIALSESEIRLLIRQSFRQNPYKFQDPRSRKGVIPYSALDDRSFDTSFPLAMGPDCLTFSILRTVYNITPGHPVAGCTSDSFVLPLEVLPHFESRWGSHLATFDPDNFAFLPPNDRVGWRDWYAYSVSFSGTGEYIAFADYQMPCMTHLVIFEIIREPKFCARLLRSTMIRRGQPWVKEVMFHKESPLVAFLSENKVWVWEFRKENAEPVCLQTSNTLPGRLFESLTFSACGRYLLARDKTDVDVLPIPKDMLALKTIAQPTDLGAVQATMDTASTVQESQHRDLQLMAFRPGNLISDSHLVKMASESNGSQTLLVTTIDNELKVESKQLGVSDRRSYLQILSLPESFNTENTAVNLQVPTSSTESLRVVFNKRAAESYSLSDGRTSQYPSIVEKKLTSITQIEETVERHRPLLEDEVEPSYKRAKIDFGHVGSSRMFPRIEFCEDDRQLDSEYQSRP